MLFAKQVPLLPKFLFKIALDRETLATRAVWVVTVLGRIAFLVENVSLAKLNATLALNVVRPVTFQGKCV